MATSEKRIGVTEFKAKCLALIDEVAEGKLDKIVLTRHGKAVAEIKPVERSGVAADPWGSMRGSVIVPPGLDLMEAVPTDWNAERGLLFDGDEPASGN